ncbi:MAG: hypothetical protein QXK63_01725, partial [Thermoproteus sp.]
RDVDVLKIEALLEHIAFEVRGKNLGSIISIERVGRSFEISTTQAKLARHIAHRIHEALPSDYVESYKKLRGRGDKEVYHYTATLYIMTLEEGDVVRRGPSYYLVLDVNKTDIYLVDIVNRSRVRIPLYRFSEVKTEKVGRGVKGEIKNGIFTDLRGKISVQTGEAESGLAYYVEIGDRHYVISI